MIMAQDPRNCLEMILVSVKRRGVVKLFVSFFHDFKLKSQRQNIYFLTSLSTNVISRKRDSRNNMTKDFLNCTTEIYRTMRKMHVYSIHVLKTYVKGE